MIQHKPIFTLPCHSINGITVLLTSKFSVYACSALVVWNNRKTIEISSLYIDFTMYGPFPTKLSSEAKGMFYLKKQVTFGSEEKTICQVTCYDMIN